MSDNNLAAMLEQVEQIPDAPESAWDAVREWLPKLAPDLAECVLGVTSA